MLAVLRREPGAPLDLREKSLYLAARLLEMTGGRPAGGYRAAQQALDGAALQAFERIIAAQGRAPCRRPAPHRPVVTAAADGRIREIDCWQMARVAKCAGAPAHAAAGVRLLRTVGDVVGRGEPLFEIHAQSEASSASRGTTPPSSRTWCVWLLTAATDNARDYFADLQTDSLIFTRRPRRATGQRG